MLRISSILPSLTVLFWILCSSGPVVALAAAPRARVVQVHTIPLVEVEYQVNIPTERPAVLPFGKAWRTQRHQVQQDCGNIKESIESCLGIRHEDESPTDLSSDCSSRFECQFSPKHPKARRSQTIRCEITAEALGEDGYDQVEKNQQSITRDVQEKVQQVLSACSSSVQSDVILLVGPQSIEPNPKESPNFSYKYQCQLLLDKKIPEPLPWQTKPRMRPEPEDDDRPAIAAAISFLHDGVFERLDQDGWKFRGAGWSDDRGKTRGRRRQNKSDLSTTVDLSVSLSPTSAMETSATEATQNALMAMASTHEWLMDVQVLNGGRRVLPRWKFWKRDGSAGILKGTGDDEEQQHCILKYRLTFHDDPSKSFCALSQSPHNLRQRQLFDTQSDINFHLNRCMRYRMKSENNWHVLSGGGSSEAAGEESDTKKFRTKQRHRRNLRFDPKYSLPESFEDFQMVACKILMEEAEKYDFFRVEVDKTTKPSGDDYCNKVSTGEVQHEAKSRWKKILSAIVDIFMELLGSGV